MKLISDEYKRLNLQLHDTNPGYGTSGHKWARDVAALARSLPAHSILDYGCGKRTLEKALGFRIQNYDPCIPGLDAAPEPADLVVCGDVLEHIEPDLLDNVLDDLQRVAKKCLFAVVHTGPAMKVLADGRNAHLIQMSCNEWLVKHLLPRWNVIQVGAQKNEFAFIGGPK